MQREREAPDSTPEIDGNIGKLIKYFQEGIDIKGDPTTLPKRIGNRLIEIDGKFFAATHMQLAPSRNTFGEQLWVGFIFGASDQEVPPWTVIPEGETRKGHWDLSTTFVSYRSVVDCLQSLVTKSRSIREALPDRQPTLQQRIIAVQKR